MGLFPAHAGGLWQANTGSQRRFPMLNKVYSLQSATGLAFLLTLTTQVQVNDVVGYRYRMINRLGLADFNE
jgi:hypothetical protein